MRPYQITTPCRHNQNHIFFCYKIMQPVKTAKAQKLYIIFRISKFFFYIFVLGLSAANKQFKAAIFIIEPFCIVYCYAMLKKISFITPNAQFYLEQVARCGIRLATLLRTYIFLRCKIPEPVRQAAPLNNFSQIFYFFEICAFFIYYISNFSFGMILAHIFKKPISVIAGFVFFFSHKPKIPYENFCYKRRRQHE